MNRESTQRGRAMTEPMSGRVTTASLTPPRLKCAFGLFVLACVALCVTNAAAQTVAPPNSAFKAGSVYGLASGTTNVGTGNMAGGYFGNGGGKVFDVAMTNGTGFGTQLFVFQSNGDGSFSLPASGMYNFGAAVQDGLNMILAGPVVSPGSSDLVVTDDFGKLYLLRGNGDGTFQNPVSLGQTASTLSSYLNSSGTLNLITSFLTFPTSSTTQSVVNVLTNANDGTGTFTAQSVPIPVNLSVNQVSALSASGATALLVVYSDGTTGFSEFQNGAFQSPISAGILGTKGGLAAGTITTFTWKGAPYFASLAKLGTGAGVYTWPVLVSDGGVVTAGPAPQVFQIPTKDAVYVTTADLDGDGNPDLIVLGGGQFSTTQTVNLFLSGSANGFNPLGNPGTPNEILGPGVYGIQALAADANGDGKLDLLLYEGSQGLTVLLNQANGAFLTPTTYAAGNTPKSVAKADFNGDGVHDLVVANGENSSTDTSDNTVSVFVSTAPGSYATQAAYPVGKNPVSVATGIVNGHQSIFALSDADTTGNFSNPVISFLQGNGDGTFQTPVYIPTGTNVSTGSSPLSIATGIFDASGNSTVAVGDSDGTINLFTYQAGAFVESATLKATPAAPAFGLSLSSLAVADMNGDGNMDLVATLRGQCGFNLINGSEALSGGAILIFAGNGAGGFQPVVTVTPAAAGSDPASVALGNILSATRIDMLVIDAQGKGASCASGSGITGPNPIIFANDGNLTFTETDLPAQFGGVSSTSLTVPVAAIADVNGDGLNDLIFSQNGLVSALLQGGPGTLISIPTFYVGSSSSVGLVTGSFFSSGGHDVALASSSGVALLQASLSAVAPPPVITVVVNPSEVSVVTGLAQQFISLVTGTPNTAVNWSVRAGGAGGTISASGLYTAPSTTGTDIVIATSAASPTSSGLATVVVTAPLPPPPSPQITSVTPNSALQGAQGLPVVIQGANFVAGLTSLAFNGPSGGISVSSFTATSATSATALLNIAPSTTPGSYDVVVSVVGAPLPATLSGGFTVLAPDVTFNMSETITLNETVIAPPPVTLTGIGAPVAFYSVGSLGFVGVPAGQTETQTVTVSNVGQQALTISADSISQDASNSFSVTQVLCSDATTSIADTLPSGGSCTLTISYTAPASGTPAGSITFTDNSQLSNLASTGSGSTFTQSLVLSTTAPTTSAPAAPSAIITVNVSDTVTIVDAAIIPPPITLTSIGAPVAFYSVGSLGFLGVPSGQTVAQAVTVSNVGLQALTISGDSISQDASNSFSVTQVLCSDGRTSIADTLPSGESCTLTISYTAPASGTPAGSITFTDNSQLSNLTSTASGSSFAQSLALSTTAATTTAPSAPSATITINVADTVTLVETPTVPLGQSIAFTQTAPTSASFNGTFTVGAQSTSGLTVTLSVDSASTAVCSIGTPTVASGVTSATVTMLSGTGTCTIDATQAGNSVFGGALPQQTSATAVLVGQATLTVTGPASVTYGTTGTATATGGSGAGLLSFSAGASTGCSVAGTTVSVTNVAGTCSLTATKAADSDYLAATSAAFTVTLTPANQSISFNPVAPLIVGGSENLTASATSGLPVAFISTTIAICTVSGNAVTGVTPGSCVLNANQAGNANYNTAPQVTQTILIGGTSQVITFGPPPSVLVGNSGTVSASASSGLPVTFGTTTPTICGVSGNIVTGVAVGTCVVTANQAGNFQFLPAPQVTQSLPIGSGQVITFTQVPAKMARFDTATVVVTASSGLPVTLISTTPGFCTLNGNTLTGIAIGSCILSASQGGDAQYFPAPTVTATIAIELPQRIVFSSTSPSSLTVGENGTLVATSNSGLPVTFTSTTPGICSVTGVTVTGLAAGDCVVAANQAGNRVYASAAQVTSTILVGASQTITSGAVASPIPTGSTGTASATASSGLPVFYGTTTPGNCTIGLAVNGVVNVTGVSAGSCVVTANQSGNATFAPAPQVTQTVTIGTSQTITFNPTALPLGGSATLVATATSGLPVTFGAEVGNGSNCTVSGNTVSTSGGGVCIVFAAQIGNAQYLPAPVVTQTIRIERPQAITFTSIPASLAIGANGAFTATSAAGLKGQGGLTGLAVTVTSTTPNICTVSGSTVTGVAAGTCVLAGNQAGGTGTSGGAPFEPAPQVTVSIPVGASQTITFGAAPAPIATGSTGTVSATASSGLPVLYGTTTPGNCSIGLAVNGVVNVMGVSAGSCIVTANQPGNATFAPAPQASQTVTIGTAQTITFSPTDLPAGGTATLVATATSGLPVNFGYVSGNCAVSGDVVSTTGGGVCVVFASQFGNGQYLPAQSVTQTIRIERLQAITFTLVPASLGIGANGAITATSGAGLKGQGGPTGLAVTVTSTTPNICTVSGSTVTGVAGGECVVAANQPGGAVGTGNPYAPAPQVTATIPVGASQTITFGAAPAPIAVGSTGTASATASSGLPVFYGTTTPGNCTIGLAVNGVVNVTGVSAGSCVVTANQSGNATYAPAPQASQTVTIGTTQTITFTPTVLLHGGTATLVATATSGLPVSFFVQFGTSSNCTVIGTTVSTPSGGNCVVVASQFGNAQYLPAPNVTQTIRIELVQTITFSSFPASLAVGASGSLAATSNRGLPVTFSSTTTGICTVSGSTVKGVAAGDCVVAANAAAGVSTGGVPIEPATLTETIPVGATQTITLGPAPLVLVGGTGTVNATASSGLPVTFGSATPTVCTVSGNIVTGVTFGTCIVTANQPGNTQFLPAPQITETLTD